MTPATVTTASPSNSRSKATAAGPSMARHERLMLWLVSRLGGLGVEGSWLSRYGTALGALAVATVTRRLLDPILENRAPYGIFLIAVLFVVWRAGLGPALATVCGGALLGRYFFDTPRESLSLVTESNQVSLIMSLTIGTFAALVCESLRVTARDNRRLYELSRQADARKDEFLATLAHELRNPLTPIRNAVHLLERGDSNEQRAAELHEMIGRHAEHLIRLVNDLLDVSRITQGKISLCFEPVDVRAVAMAAVEAAAPLINEKRQDLHVALPQGNVFVRGDRVRLTQVVTNLLHNASKYTDKEGRVWLSVETVGEQLMIRVRDTGAGIAPEMCDAIFDLFKQVHQGIENSQGGLGIGLTLVRALVALHGGTIEATSPGLGLGSEFVVRLPGILTIGAIQSSPAADRVDLSATRSASLRILVVDDSSAVARSLEMILKDWNHNVCVCADGFAALEAARTFQPDVILADLGMPRMNGYQLAEELRRLPTLQNAVLVAVSGYGQVADQRRSHAVGFARHLVKPVDLGELKQVLAAEIAKRN